MTLKNILLLSCIFFYCNVVLAKDEQIISSYNEKIFSQQFENFYKNLPDFHSKNIATRILDASNNFINKPYFNGPLGEGPQGKFDQSPLFRDDVFDCQTFVETALALANGHDLESFKKHLNLIRYKNGEINFKYRNHFTNVDWNKNNSLQGYIQDITYKFVDRNGNPIAEVSDTIIDKPNWYKNLKWEQIKQLKQSSKNLLQELHDLFHEMQKEKSVILYIPLTQLFDEHQQPRLEIFNQIPSGAIIEIVRPRWNLIDKIGTELDVSHLGFAFRIKNNLFYREASSVEKKVTDLSLINYLRSYLKSSTVKGINVEIPTERNVER